MSNCNCPSCEITRGIYQLNKDELQVLVHVLRGLLKGQTQYGPLEAAKDPRDMVKETLEEVRDGLVYIGAALVKLQENVCAGVIPGTYIACGEDGNYCSERCRLSKQGDA